MMPARHGQKPIHGYVPNDIHDRWHDACRVAGFPVSALLEVIGEDIEKVIKENKRGERARLIAAKRRRRNNMAVNANRQPA